MSQARTTALVVAGSLVAWGGVLAYRKATEPTQPTSPVVVESPQEKADRVQAAFTRAGQVDDAEVEGFVQALQAAVSERDAARVIPMVAPARMLDGVEAATGKSLPPVARSAIEAELGSELLEFFDPTVVEIHVKRVDRDAQGNLVVYVRTIDRDRITMKSRWWLYHDGNGLRWWDGEDLQLGLRISTAMAAGIIASDAQGKSDALERFLEVVTRLADLAMDDTVKVRQLADDLDGLVLEGLPPSFRHLAIVARASTAVALGEPAVAIERLDALEADPLHPPDMPMRHYLRASAELALDHPEAAAAAIERYLAQLGDDAEAFHMLGMAKLSAGDAKGALAAFDRGLADDPALPDNYGGVAMAADDVAAVAERLREAPDDGVLDAAARWLEQAEDGEGLARLVAAAARARPGWDTTPWAGKVVEGARP